MVYFGCHIYILTGILYFDSEFKFQLFSLFPFFPLTLVALTTYSTYLYYTVKRRPGYVGFAYGQEYSTKEEYKTQKSPKQFFEVESADSLELNSTSRSALSDDELL